MMSEKKGAVNSPASASMPWAIIVPRNQVTLRARITKLVTNSGMISLTQRAAAISRITSATWLGAGIPHAPKTSSSRTPSSIGRWKALRPEISPMPPARLLTTAVYTASLKSFLPEAPPELISGTRPM
jgi:hypothetical protein